MSIQIKGEIQKVCKIPIYVSSRPKMKCSYLRITNINHLTVFKEYLYQDASIYLDRKKTVFDKMTIS